MLWLIERRTGNVYTRTSDSRGDGLIALIRWRWQMDIVLQWTYDVPASIAISEHLINQEFEEVSV